MRNSDTIRISDPGLGTTLDISDVHGPRAIARALMGVFNDDPMWDLRHVGQCALVIADYTAGAVRIDAVRKVLARADLEAHAV